MRNVNVDVYKFNELSEKVQKKVIDRYQMNYEISNELKMAMEDKFYDIVGGICITFKLTYSLACCQGDGVSFTGIVECKEELLKLANLVYNGNIPRKILRLINWGIIYKVDFDRTNSHYVHKYTVNIEVVDNYNMNNDYCRIVEAMTEFEKSIKDWYLDVCSKLEDFGYSEIEYLQSDEYIREIILNSDLEFLADGSDF